MSSVNKQSIAVVSLALIFAVASGARGQVLNVNFGRSNDGVTNAYTGQGAYADVGNNTWNNILSTADAFPTGSPFTNLVYSNGAAATGVGVTLAGSGGSQAYYNAAFPQLLRGAIHGNGTTYGSDIVTVTGLSPTATYDLYVYSTKDNARDVEFRIQGTELFTLAGQVGNVFQLDENYHAFTGLAAPAGTLAIEWRSLTTGGGSLNQAPFNGFQLIARPATAAVPEPSSIAVWLLLGIGVAAFGLRALGNRK